MTITNPNARSTSAVIPKDTLTTTKTKEETVPVMDKKKRSKENATRKLEAALIAVQIIP